MATVIKMLVSMAGANESYQPGDLLTVSDNVAEAWVGAKIAELHVEQPPKIHDYVPDPTPHAPAEDANPPDDEATPVADPAPEAAVEPATAPRKGKKGGVK